jgi:poly-gamma-glutamate synthesis protein (capsule biosynthesis protein)
MDSLLNRIRQIRIHEPAACIIISLHWGWEHTTEPTLEQKITARQLIDAGADALVCHHSHTLQRIDFYHDKPIYYSIGNFIFDQTKPINTQTAIVRLTITADTMKAETIPVVIERCAPQLQSSTSLPFSSSN